MLYTFNGENPVLSKLGVAHYFKGAGVEATVAEYNAGNAQRWVPEYRSSASIFNCEDVAASPITLHMSVWDGKLNTDFCAITLTLVDNQDACGPTSSNNCSCTPDNYTGWAVATCNADANTGLPVGVLFDIRNTTNATPGQDWAPQITAIHPSNWTIDQIGQVFGIALDNDNNVYLAASDIYDTQFNSDPYGPGQIFKASASDNFLAKPFVNLPNTGGSLNGIGGLVYCKESNSIYASNLEDGKIYRVSSTGQISSTFDPWSLDNGQSGICSQAEQVWGLGINKENGNKKLYFARINGSERSMYSITLKSDGSFPSAGSEKLEFANIMGVGLRVSDIEFNTDGNRMIISERGTKFITGAHDSKVIGYKLGTNGVWTMNNQYYAGGMVNEVYPGIATAPGENAAGGLDFGPTKVNSNNIEGCDELVWMTTNWFRKPDGTLYYGMQSNRLHQRSKYI